MKAIVQANHESGGASDAGHGGPGHPLIVTWSRPGPGVRGWVSVSSPPNSDDNEGDQRQVSSARGPSRVKQSQAEASNIPVGNIVRLSNILT